MNETLWFLDRRYSQITERHPDRKIYPQFYKARRMEYILRPGEMLMIPAGWFHFVFSEETDEKTGLCAAVNFWYHTQVDRFDKSELKPEFGWHNINFDEVLNVLKGKKMQVRNSPFNFFPPSHVHYRYPEITSEYMSFDDFYKAKNSQHYIAQNSFKELDKFNVACKPPSMSSVWINWGNCNTLPHYDGHDNWLCQLKGIRRVILTPPEDRDFMYLFNSYPLDFILDVKKRLENNETLIRESKSITQNVVQELLEALDKQNEVVVTCTDLSSSFEKELHIHNHLLLKNGSEKLSSNLKCSLFHIKKYSKGDVLFSECPFGIFWFLTPGTLKIRKTHVNESPGNLVSYPGNWLYPVKVESDCILVVPHGFSNGTRWTS
jgi:hypothetical protein